jgi:hypothetical protein
MFGTQNELSDDVVLQSVVKWEVGGPPPVRIQQHLFPGEELGTVPTAQL